MVQSITDFLSTEATQTFSNPAQYAQGYQSSNLYILMQQAQRQKLVKTNYLSDVSHLERDPNYSKKYVVNQYKLQVLIGNLSLATHLATTASSLVFMTGVKEFIPNNLDSLLYNFMSLSNSGISSFNDIQQGDIFKQVGVKLLSDLLNQYTSGYMNLDMITLMAQTVTNNMQLTDSVKNNGLRPLLSLPLSYIFGSSMTSILTDLQFLDTVYSIFGNQTQADNFVADLNSGITTYSNTNVSTIVNVADYENQPITLKDPLGLSLQQSFSDTLMNDYQDQLSTILDHIAPLYGLNAFNQTVIDATLRTNAKTVVETTFAGDLGLPSISNVTQAINIETYNITVQEIMKAFDGVADQIVIKLNINPSPDPTVSSIDYLMNLKKNLEIRQNLVRTGTTSGDLAAIDMILRQSLKNGYLDQQTIRDLTEKLVGANG